MLEPYFAALEEAVRDFPYTVGYAVERRYYNAAQGFIRGWAQFSDESVLEFAEVKNAELPGKLKYRYHYRRKDDSLIFRYDNAPHHRELATFPHHRHAAEEGPAAAATEPELLDILAEIKQLLASS